MFLGSSQELERSDKLKVTYDVLSVVTEGIAGFFEHIQEGSLSQSRRH